MKKRILAAVIAAASVLSLAGCGEKGTSSATNNGSTPANNSSNAGGNSTPTSNGGDDTPGSSDVTLKDDGSVLTIAAWGDNADITNMVKVFLEKKGYDESKIEVTRYGTGGGTFTGAFENALKDSNLDVDIICLEADWILRWTNDDNETAPLSAIGLSESDLANPYAYTVAIGKNDAGVLKGLTFQAAPGGFVYRADLAEEYLGVKSPEEMQAKVKDWATLEATAAEYKEKSGGKALLSTEAGLWQVYQYNRSQPWVVNGKLNMAEAESFYDVAKKYYDNGYITNNTQWNDAWYASVANGDACGEFLSTWGMVDGDGGMLSQFAGNKAGDDAVLAFCDGPQFYAWGGTWLGVSTRCDNMTLAKEFISFFTCEDEGMKAYTEATGDFNNNSKVMNDIVSAGSHTNKFLVGGQDQFKTFVNTAPGVSLDGKLTKYDATIKGHFNDSVDKYMKGDMTKEEAIESFKDNVAASYSDLDVD